MDEHSCDQSEEEDDRSDLAEQQHDAMEAKYDSCIISGSFFYRHHVQERLTFHVRQESSFLIQRNYMDVVWRTTIKLDVLQEHNIDDHWNVDGDWKLSGPWDWVHPFHNTESSSTSGIYCGPGRTFTKTQGNVQGLNTYGPEVWSNMSNNFQQKEQHWAKEKPQLDNA